MFVCFGVDWRGGGNRGVLRERRVFSTSAPEPGDGSVSIVDAGARVKTSDSGCDYCLKIRTYFLEYSYHYY